MSLADEERFYRATSEIPIPDTDIAYRALHRPLLDAALTFVRLENRMSDRIRWRSGKDWRKLDPRHFITYASSGPFIVYHLLLERYALELKDSETFNKHFDSEDERQAFDACFQGVVDAMDQYMVAMYPGWNTPGQYHPHEDEIPFIKDRLRVGYTRYELGTQRSIWLEHWPENAEILKYVKRSWEQFVSEHPGLVL